MLVNGYFVNSTQLISPIFRKEFVLSKERVFPNATPKHIQINEHTQKYWTILCFVLSKVCFTFESAPSPHFHRFFNYLEIVSFELDQIFKGVFVYIFLLLLNATLTIRPGGLGPHRWGVSTLWLTLQVVDGLINIFTKSLPI